jgi:protein-S-isoprenylcysteine O-methyltransferase Ste14
MVLLMGRRPTSHCDLRVGLDQIVVANSHAGRPRLLRHRLTDLVSYTFLGKRSDVIGYRKVLLICLLGATLASVPQIFVNNYWIFVVERFAVGLFTGGSLPTANALIGRSVSQETRGTIAVLDGWWDRRGVRHPLGFAITAVLLAAILARVWFTVPELKKEEEDGRLTRSLQACGQ